MESTVSYKIIKGYDIPERKSTATNKGTGRPIEPNRCIYPISDLRIGDAFDAGPYSTKLHQKTLTYCNRSYWGTYMGYKFTSRHLDGRLIIWRIK